MSNRPQIDIVPEHPSAEDGEVILRLLNADNESRSGIVDLSDFAVILRDPRTRAVVGGLWGEDDFSWLFIRYLLVPEQYRGLGLGADMMRAAEGIAKARRKLGVWLNTFDFQAAGFYRKLGYEEFGRLDGFSEKDGKTFFRKRLTEK